MIFHEFYGNLLHISICSLYLYIFFWAPTDPHGLHPECLENRTVEKRSLVVTVFKTIRLKPFSTESFIWSIHSPVPLQHKWPTAGFARTWSLDIFWQLSVEIASSCARESTLTSIMKVSRFRAAKSLTRASLQFNAVVRWKMWWSLTLPKVRRLKSKRCQWAAIKLGLLLTCQNLICCPWWRNMGSARMPPWQPTLTTFVSETMWSLQKADAWFQHSWALPSCTDIRWSTTSWWFRKFEQTWNTTAHLWLKERLKSYQLCSIAYVCSGRSSSTMNLGSKPHPF